MNNYIKRRTSGYKEDKTDDKRCEGTDKEHEGRGTDIAHITLKEHLDIDQGICQHICLRGLGFRGGGFNRMSKTSR